MLTSLKGRAALIVALGTVAVLLVMLPAYRIFFAISLGIAIIVAVILYFWHKFHPIRIDDVDNKHLLNLK